MMNDLFGELPEPLKLPLDGAELLYFSFVDLGCPSEEVAHNLKTNTEWREEEITVWGKKFMQPRLIAWYGDRDLNYSYSGIRLNPKPWTDELLRLKKIAELTSEYKFNSVLLNYYRNQNDSMGFHSDSEPELGPKPVIASLSLGEERILVFKHKTDKSTRPYRLPLKSGSLLIMSGDTQKNWVHGIEKTARVLGPRVNLTFRNILVKK